MEQIPNLILSAKGIVGEQCVVVLPCSSPNSHWMWKYGTSAESIEPDDKNGSASYMNHNGQRTARFYMTPSEAGSFPLEFIEISHPPMMCGGDPGMVQKAEVMLAVTAPVSNAKPAEPNTFKPAF